MKNILSKNCYFFNSKTKGGSSKQQSSAITKPKTKANASPLRVPSIFCRRILGDKPEDNYVVKSNSAKLRDRSQTHKLSRTIATSSIQAALEQSSCSESKPPASTDSSPLIVRAASQFYKKLNRNRSVKRLTANYQVNVSGNVSQMGANLSSIPENVSTSDHNCTPTVHHEQTESNQNHSVNMSINNVSVNRNSPLSKQLIVSNEWQCSESIDL